MSVSTIRLSLLDYEKAPALMNVTDGVAASPLRCSRYSIARITSYSE